MERRVERRGLVGFRVGQGDVQFHVGVAFGQQFELVCAASRSGAAAPRWQDASLWEEEEAAGGLDQRHGQGHHDDLRQHAEQITDLLKEMKNRRFYEKPSIKDKRKRREAERRRRKEARKLRSLRRSRG